MLVIKSKRYIQYCRLSLAILYHNENVNRAVRVYKTGPQKGQPMYSISRSKENKLQPRAVVLKVPPTFGESTKATATNTLDLCPPASPLFAGS